jgi:hypothetical protein
MCCASTCGAPIFPASTWGRSCREKSIAPKAENQRPLRSSDERRRQRHPSVASSPGIPATSCAYDIGEFDFPAMPRVSISPNRSYPPTSSMQPKVKFRCCRHGSTSTGAAQTPVLVMTARLGRRGAGYGLDGRGLQDVSLGIQIVGARA